MRVLFVGNSLTYYNGGLDKQVAALSKSSGAYAVEAEMVVEGGASLQHMFDRTDARARIEAGEWDVVVLQEDLPETDVDTFKAYVRKFETVARLAGARTVLYMTWPYGRLGWIDQEGIAAAHYDVADSLRIGVAGVGEAWAAVQAERPDLNLYHKDNEHPNAKGHFLAACLVYLALAEPVGYRVDAHDALQAYRPSGTGGEVGDYLRRVAVAQAGRDRRRMEEL